MLYYEPCTYYNYFVTIFMCSFLGGEAQESTAAHSVRQSEKDD